MLSLVYETRAQWSGNNPDTLGWQPAESRLNPLGGQYVARISATTAIEAGAKIIRGFDTTASKGAGIRVYEYAGENVIKQCRSQLEALFWLCADAPAVHVVERHAGLRMPNLVEDVDVVHFASSNA